MTDYLWSSTIRRYSHGILLLFGYFIDTNFILLSTATYTRTYQSIPTKLFNYLLVASTIATVHSTVIVIPFGLLSKMIF